MQDKHLREMSSALKGLAGIRGRVSGIKAFSAVSANWRSGINVKNLQISILQQKPQRLTINKYININTNIGIKNYSTNASIKSSLPKESHWKKKSTWFLAGSIILGSLYITNIDVSDFIKHTCITVKRVGVVTVATARCFAKYGGVLRAEYGSPEERNEALNDCHQQCADITLKALGTNGGVYIKLGQHLSAMTYLLPPQWTETMTPLQDECPRSSVESIKLMFKNDTGLNLEDYFSSFDEEPIGTASLAQVHKAVLRENGQEVAVKFQHPSLEEFVPLDIWLTKAVFALMYKVFPGYPLTWLGDEMQTSIYVELNFNEEAKNATNTAEYFKDYTKYTALRIPKIISAQRRILIMEFVGGAKANNLEYLEKNNISRADVSYCFSNIFNNMIFTPGVGVHCDPHGGNIAIRALSSEEQKSRKAPFNFEVILYDHGLYRKIPLNLRRDYAHFWLALIDKDTLNMRKYAKRFANITDEEFPILAAALTGRDFEHATGNITSIRSEKEIDRMADALTNGGLITNLMSLLAKVPRVVLLIIKTNDLTRRLDEDLGYPLGPVRTFLILASYCARTTYDEQKEMLKLKYSNQGFSISKLFSQIRLWWRYTKRVNQLYIYDLTVHISNLLHISTT